MQKDTDLVDLIDNANKAISGNQPLKSKRKRSSYSFSFPGKVFIYGLFPVAVYTFIDRFSEDELTDIEIETQLINILHSAQNSVRTHIASNEAPPPVIPSAALAAIVQYEVRGNDYVLTTSSNGITVSLDSLGNLSTEFSGS